MAAASQFDTAEDTASCFGFRIHSTETFRFLREGGGQEDLHVSRTAESFDAGDEPLLFEWRLRDRSSTVTARLYGRDGIFNFWASDAGWFRIDAAARRIVMSDHADDIRREQRLWGIPSVVCAKHRGDFVLHAAAVEIDGGAVLLAAPGRYGKTTLAMALHCSGFRLLTEDTACCTLAGGPHLYPGPTSVRVRPDMFDGRPPDGTTITAIRDDRIHLALSPDRSGDGCRVPIKALVFLRESAKEIFLAPVLRGRALPDLWTLVFRFRGIDDRRQSFSDLAQLATAIPIWNLHRPLQVSKLSEVINRLVDVVGDRSSSRMP